MLSAVVLTIIASSAQAVIADHDVLHSRQKTNTFDPDFNVGYEVYLQTTIRDAQGQLLSVSEQTNAWVLVPTFSDGVIIPDFIDYVFDGGLLGEKEVIAIDNVKYEKIQFVTEDGYSSEGCPTCDKVSVTSGIVYKGCGTFEGTEYGYQCISIFKAKTPQMHIAEDNVIIHQWTILRIID